MNTASQKIQGFWHRAVVAPPRLVRRVMFTVVGLFILQMVARKMAFLPAWTLLAIGVASQIEGTFMLAPHTSNSFYDTLLLTYGEEFLSFPLETKCAAYFALLGEDFTMPLLTESFSYENTANEKLFALSEFAYLNDRKLGHILYQDFVNMGNAYRSRKRKVDWYEKQMVASISHVRMYGHCFVNNTVAMQRKHNQDNNINPIVHRNADQWKKYQKTGHQEHSEVSQSRIYNYERSVLPWLHSVFPVYTRWDGTVVDSGLPVIAEFTNPTGDKLLRVVPYTRGEPMIPFMQKHSSGHGIVILGGNKFVDELVGLLKVLRAVGNTLPIEIVVSSEISLRNRDRIIKAARSSRAELGVDGITPPAEMSAHYLKAYKLGNPLATDFPEQEVWFVNLRRSVLHLFRSQLNLWDSKLYAILLLLFQHVVLMDDDTVPVEAPAMWFETPQYKTTGTLFFRDRELLEKMRPWSYNTVMRILPSVVDEFFFEIPRATGHTLSNRLVAHQATHYMESGVVLIDKARHIPGLLVATQLQNWPATAIVGWGDKELYWLGLLAVGDENYAWSDYGASAIGHRTPDDLRPFTAKMTHYDPKFKNIEVCSTHPGHLINEADPLDPYGKPTPRLAWFNSGFRECKIHDWKKEREEPLYFRKLEEEVKKIWREPFMFDMAIVPPPLFRLFNTDLFWGLDLQHDSDPVLEVGRLRDRELNVDIEIKGWSKINTTCNGYQWCAVDRVNHDIFRELNEGTVVRFDAAETLWFEYLGWLWMSDQAKWGK